MEEAEVLETCLYFLTAQMPNVTFHSEPLGTAKVYSSSFRHHKHSLLQPFQDRQATGTGRISSLGKEYTQKRSSFIIDKNKEGCQTSLYLGVWLHLPFIRQETPITHKPTSLMPLRCPELPVSQDPTPLLLLLLFPCMSH